MEKKTKKEELYGWHRKKLGMTPEQYQEWLRKNPIGPGYDEANQKMIEEGEFSEQEPDDDSQK